MKNYPSVERLLALQKMIADFAKVERSFDFADNPRKENDVDHSYGLAMFCWYLQPKIAPELDLGKILLYALAHDIVELHAGDTYFMDEEGRKQKDQRERDAIAQLRNDWPDFSGLADYAEGYMDKTNEEARFVKAIDKMLPLLVIELHNDPTIFWKQKQLSLAIERDNKQSMHISEFISPYYEKVLDWLDKRNNIPKD